MTAMQTMPFEMELTGSNGTRQAVCCRERLRVIPQRRTVFAGSWQGRPVIVKRFEDCFSGYRCGREKRGLERLLARGLATPKVLLSGKDAGGHHVLVIETIENAADVLTAIQSLSFENAVRDLLLAVFRYVADMHRAGVVQKDFHLGNFLIAGSTVYAIDPACMRFRHAPIAPEPSYRQLAVLLATLPRPFLAAWDVAFVQLYCTLRGLTYSPDVMERIRCLAERRRAKRLPHALKKTLRNSKHFFVLQTPGCRGVFCREAFDSDTARRFMEQIELHGEASIEKDYEIIRYEPGNRLQAFVWRMVQSPARRDWLNAWRLLYGGGTGPRPAAFIEKGNFAFLNKAWYIAGGIPSNIAAPLK